jgi:hypothetical protein
MGVGSACSQMVSGKSESEAAAGNKVSARLFPIERLYTSKDMQRFDPAYWNHP